MPARVSYDYTVVRVAPRVEREEFLNAGVVLFSKARRFLAARVGIDEARLRAFAPEVDVELVRRHLDAIRRVCEGDEEAGPIARLSQSGRFQWLAAPRSTIIQMSPVHGGVCEEPAVQLEELFQRLVG